MIESATNLKMNLPFGGPTLDALFHRRDFELKRGYASNSEGWRAFLAYISEGFGSSQDWELVMKYQRRNGSLFNSPATTASAFTHLKNADCLKYLRTLLEKFGNAVPTVYPLHKHVRLSMVASLESLGVDRHFREEIRSVLDETYRCWLQGDEDIFSDAATCAMAFRLLRVNGYDVSADPLTQYSEDRFFNSLGGYMMNIGDALELFRASETIIHPDESVLEKQHYWTSHFLKQELSNTLIQGHRLNKHIGLEVSCLNIGNEDFLKLAVDDFNNCQSIHREELNHFTRWVEEYRLDKLKFARQKQAYSYFSAAATLFPPELSDARISWAKNGVLATVVDDFFDVGGSEKELINLIQLVEKWDVNVSVDCCSENVEIIFSALKNTINEIGARAFTRQGRSVTSHVIEIWLDLIKSMFKEAEWLRNKSVPTMEEYMENAYVSIGLGPIVLPALYLVGPKLSEEAVGSSEFHHLYRLMSTAGRLLNDIQGFKRESAERKLNAVSLAMIHGSGVTEEEAISEMKNVIVSKRRELLRLVLLEKGSVVPRACKDLFWNMSKVLHLFYAKHDGFTAHDMMKTAYAVIEEPILLSEL
ncbi:ent-kaurene synthase-like 1 [Malus domestica]|uniref:ent-kaurene synthase-like 1 n=1 Tax=Malus domestica TaxID=3750 RepID=UPI003976B354